MIGAGRLLDLRSSCLFIYFTLFREQTLPPILVLLVLVVFPYVTTVLSVRLMLKFACVFMILDRDKK